MKNVCVFSERHDVALELVEQIAGVEEAATEPAHVANVQPPRAVYQRLYAVQHVEQLATETP